MSTWIDRAVAIRTVDADDVPTDGKFRIWKFVGATLTPDGDRLVITITGEAGTPYDDDPEGLGVFEGGPGVSLLYARGDHQHAHGELPGGTLHAAASGSAAGFMTSAQFTKLATIASYATAGYWPVAAIATSNVNLSAPGTTVDGATMTAGEIFAALAQSTAAQRGVYVWNGAAVAATRHPRLPSPATAGDLGLTVRAYAGANQGKAYMLDSYTSPLTWVDVTGAGGGGGGTGIANGGGSLDLDGSGNLATTSVQDMLMEAQGAADFFGHTYTSVGTTGLSAPTVIAGSGITFDAVNSDIKLRAGALDYIEIYDDGDYAIEGPAGVGVNFLAGAALGLGGTSVVERAGTASRTVTTSGSDRVEVTTDSTGAAARTSTIAAATSTDEYIGSHELRIATRTTDSAPPKLSFRGGNSYASSTGTNRNGGGIDARVGYGRTGGTDLDGNIRIGLGRLTSPNGSGAFSLYADDNIGGGAYAYEGMRGRIDLGGNAYWYAPVANMSVLAAINAYLTAFAGLVEINGFTGVKITGNLGFYGGTPVAKPTVTGSRGGNAALASLLTALASQGLITDSSS